MKTAPWKTKFSYKCTKWSMVDDEESNAYSINTWYEGCPNNKYSAYCELSNKTFSITNIGFGQIESHALKK